MVEKKKSFIVWKKYLRKGMHASLFRWEDILRGYCTNLSKDEMIIVLQVGLGLELNGNIFKGRSWDYAGLRGWSEDLIDKAWKKFVMKNEETFRKIADMAYVEGETVEKAVLWSEPEEDFFDHYSVRIFNEDELKSLEHIRQS